MSKNLENELPHILNKPWPWLSLGIAAIGFGWAINGMASCAARDVEARTKAEVENKKDIMEYNKWMADNDHGDWEEHH